MTTSTLTSTFAQAVAGNVRAELARHRISQQELASRIGMAKGAVSARMTGQRQWQLEDLEKVAKVIGCDPAELVIGGRYARIDGEAGGSGSEGLGFESLRVHQLFGLAA